MRYQSIENIMLMLYTLHLYSRCGINYPLQAACGAKIRQFFPRA